MRFESIPNLEIRIPHFDPSIPSNADEIRRNGLLSLRFRKRAIPNATDPVLMVIQLTRVLTVGQSVPELDSLISSRGYDLSVIRRKLYGEDFLGMALENPAGFTKSEVPESECLIPRARNQELIIL